MRFIVTLDPPEAEHLLRLADSERRRVGDQAAVLIVAALQRLQQSGADLLEHELLQEASRYAGTKSNEASH